MSRGFSSLPHGGTLELTLINDDKNTHCAVLPSNGDTQFLWLVNHSKGTATLELDGPGYYWYGSTTGNDEGRGLTGAIVVGGDVPPEARLDRPAPAAPVGRSPGPWKGALDGNRVRRRGDGHPLRDPERRRRQGAAGGQGRHLRADSQRSRRTAELADLLRRLRRAALQPAGPDQHGQRRQAHARSGCSRPARWACTRARRRTRGRPPRSSSTASCSCPAGTASSGRSTPRTATSCGATSTRPRSTCRCAAATSTAGSRSPRAWSS